MPPNTKTSFEGEIQSIYSSFLKCISVDNSNRKLATVTCLEGVLDKLEEFKRKNSHILTEKIDTLMTIIQTKINISKTSLMAQTDNGNYLKRFNELGVRYVKTPSRKFKDVHGLENIKKTLQMNVVYPLQFNDLSREFGIRTNGGILFYGPPGNGKTYLAESLAGEAGIAFLESNPAFLYNEYFGKFEKNISEIFNLAKETAPNILFFDEVETLIPRRENADHSVVKRGVTQLLIEINKLMSNAQNKTFLVAATNLPWEIDPAMLRPGRFDLKIYIPLPEKSDREELIKYLLASPAFSKDINASEIADKTGGFSISDIDYIIRQAAENVFYEAVESGKKRTITKNDILDNIARIKPSSNKTLIQKYKEFM